MEAALDDHEFTDSDFSTNGSPFPNEFVNPTTKEGRKYGLQYAKAVYYSTGRLGGTNMFWNNSEYEALMEIAQGRQSVEGIRKMFGYFDNPSSPKDDGSESLAYLDVQVLNLAPKYINRAVQKIVNRRYSVQLDAIDPVSVHEKETYEANIKTYYELKEWMDSMEMKPRDYFPDLDVDVLPEFPDELMYELLTNPKVKKSIDGTMALTLIQEMNDFNQKMRMFAWNKVVFGRGHLHCFRDENGVPRIENINPKYYVGSYSENEDFSGQEYAGYFDFPTVSQFRKEAAGDLPQEEIESIVRQFSQQNIIDTIYSPSVNTLKMDGLNYIPVLRFYYLSQDDRVFVTRKNFAGNSTLMERGLNWKPSPNDEKTEKIIKNSYTSVYGGTWVLDTETVYNYGRKQVPRSNLVDVRLPIVTFAPNYKDGRTVSFAAQMIEPLFMVNVAWNKIKEYVAKGWMGIQNVDFSMLETVALGKGGQNWSPREIMTHFLQTNRMISRSPINKHDQRYSSSAVTIDPSGIQMADYMNILTTSINMLEQMTGTTAAESVDQPDRMAVRVMQQSQETGDLDMGYLFNSYEYSYLAASNQLLLLLQEAKRDGVGIQGFVSALGQHFAVPDSLPYSDYGMFLVKDPSDQEWADFYGELALGLQSGAITHLDSAFIREVKNLKKARIVLGYRIKLNERKQKQMVDENNRANMEANRTAAADKMQADLAISQADHKNALELIQLQGRIDELLLVRKYELEGVNTDKTNETKKVIAKQTSVDEIIKQAVSP